MEIFYNRNGSGKKEKDVATIGEFIVGHIKTLILEDDYDDVKDYGHTRILSGRFKLKLRKEGAMHEKYKKRFPEFHLGMIQLMDVPNYNYIYYHCGQRPEETLGCLLSGLDKISEACIIDSEKAYRVNAPLITYLLEIGVDVYLNITD